MGNISRSTDNAGESRHRLRLTRPQRTLAPFSKHFSVARFGVFEKGDLGVGAVRSSLGVVWSSGSDGGCFETVAEVNTVVVERGVGGNTVRARCEQRCERKAKLETGASKFRHQKSVSPLRSLVARS